MEILKGIEDQERVISVCGRCGKGVVPDNDSGWDCFVNGGTAPICSDCWVKPDEIMEKSGV